MNTSKLARFCKNNGLSVVLFLLFIIFLFGHAISGWLYYNEEQAEQGRPNIGLVQYLNTGSFAESVFENWESEFLQMGVYVVLTVFLFQKGSSESKDPEKPKESTELGSGKSKDLAVPFPVRKGGWLLALYNHSLSFALILLFLLSFIGHVIAGTRAFNEEAIKLGQPTVDAWEHIRSAQFWFESFQNWQSEFLAILSIVVLSIWLREKGSPESKPVAMPHSDTGG